MKVLKSMRILILPILLLLLVCSGSIFVRTYDSVKAKSVTISSTDTKTNEYVVVSNFASSSGVFEEDVEYYLIGDNSRYIPFNDIDYTIGSSIPSGVYEKLDTYSVYNVSGIGTYTLVGDMYTELGNSAAMSSYVSEYALLGIVTDSEYTDIDITVGLHYDTSGVYGTFYSHKLINISSGDNITLNGVLSCTNTSNVSKCAIHIGSGVVHSNIDIHSSSRYVYSVDTAGVLYIDGGTLSSDGDSVVYIGSSASADTPLQMNSGTIHSTSTGYGIHNDSSKGVSIYGGTIDTTGNAIQNSATGDIVVRSDSAVSITSASGSAIYNSLKANISISGGVEDTVLVGKGVSTIYLNKGDISIHGATIENKSITGDNVYITNTDYSQVVDVSDTNFILPITSTGYHIYNSIVSSMHGYIYLGTGITYTGGVFIYTKAPESIVAESKDGTMKYAGDVVTIYYYGHDGGTITGEDKGAIVVSKIDSTNAQLFTVANTTNFMLKVDSTNLVLAYMYRVTYSVNGADTGVAPIDSTYYDLSDTAIVKYADITKKGYEFAGWTYESILYKPNDTITVTKNILLVAEWEPIEYTIEYVVDGVTHSTDTYTLFTQTITPPSVADEGSVVYWQMSSSDEYYGWDTTTKYGSSIAINEYYGDITLTAVFEYREYSITFISDSVTIYSTTYTAESDTLIFNHTAEKEGHYFFGWVGNGVSQASKTITINTGSIGDRVYTAYFEEKSYIYYIANATDNYRLYTYTTDDTLVDILYSDDMDDIIDSMDIDRYTTSYQDSIVYLGDNTTPIIIKDIESPITFAHGKYSIYGKADFVYDTLDYTTIDSEYVDTVDGKTSMYAIVIGSEVVCRMSSISHSADTIVYIDTGAVFSVYRTEFVGSDSVHYSAIKNYGMIHILEDVQITNASLKNHNILNVRDGMTIGSDSSIYNSGTISMYSGGTIDVYGSDSDTYISIVNTGILNLNGSSTIEGSISTFECDDSTTGIYMASDYMGIVRLVLSIDTYHITKVVDNARVSDKVVLIDFICSDAGEYEYRLVLVDTDVYLKRVYTIYYDYNGGDAGALDTEYEVLDGSDVTLVVTDSIVNTGYEYVGIYRCKDSEYIDILGNSYTSLYDDSLVGNSWSEILGISEDYYFIVKWRLIAPIINNQSIYLSAGAYNGSNYIYATITNMSTLSYVVYTYTWYRSDTYSGIYEVVGTTNDNKYYIQTISDGGYYYVEVSISDGVDSSSSESNIKLIELSEAIIQYDIADYIAEYDGQSHGIALSNIVTVNHTEYTVTYSLDGVDYVDTEYRYTDYMASAVEVYFRITASEHRTVEGSATIRIDKVRITITAEDATSKYGDSLSQVQCDITEGALVNASDLGTIYATTDAVNDTIGTYTITPMYTANTNYDVSIVTGTYTVSKQDLYIKVVDKVVEYGTLVTEFDIEVVGYKLNDDISSIDTTGMVFDTVYTHTSMVGTYDVTVNGIVSSKYDIIYEKGTIVVNKATIRYMVDDFVGVYDNQYHTIYVHDILTVNSQAYSVTYSNDGGNTFNSYSAEIYKSVILGKTIWFKIVADSHDTVVDSATITINKRPITITIDNVDTTKISTVEPLTYRHTGGTFAVGEDENTLLISLSVAKQDKPGVYVISGASVNNNYDITFINGKYTIRATELGSADGTILFSTTAGVDPSITIVSTNTFTKNLQLLDTTGLAGKHTEIVQAYELSFANSDGVEVYIPQGVHTIKILIDEEYRDNENFTVVYKLNGVVLINLNAVRDGDYLVFETNLVGEYYVITDKEIEYLVAPIVILSVVLLALIVLYILQGTRYKDSEIRLKSIAPIMLSIYIPFMSKAMFIILLAFTIFMIVANGMKFLSKIVVDIDRTSEDIDTLEASENVNMDTIDNASESATADTVEGTINIVDECSAKNTKKPRSTTKKRTSRSRNKKKR